MDYAQYVVPPQPRITERRVLRRPRTRRAVQLCAASTALALIAALVATAAFLVLIAFAALSAVVAVAFRCTERRRPVLVREWSTSLPGHGSSLIHFDAGR